MVAGKTAPDCTPTVWRPSTFWCYEVRDQVTIIAGALISGITSIYGGIAFYGRFTLGRQRLSALGVDLKHLKTVVAVLATAFLIDKVIRLHKRKDEITVRTLWRDLPFDQDMDKDFVAELQTQNAELQTQVAELQTQNAEMKTQNAEMKTQLDNLTPFCSCTCAGWRHNSSATGRRQLCQRQRQSSCRCALFERSRCTRAVAAADHLSAVECSRCA